MLPLRCSYTYACGHQSSTALPLKSSVYQRHAVPASLPFLIPCHDVRIELARYAEGQGVQVGQRISRKRQELFEDSQGEGREGYAICIPRPSPEKERHAVFVDPADKRRNKAAWGKLSSCLSLLRGAWSAACHNRSSSLPWMCRSHTQLLCMA